VSVDNRSDVREFLSSRRARITPEKAGLPAFGGNRRVPGLRREEVALLAGVSVDYYTRVERGNLSGVSETVLEALARALQLDEAEREHLIDLARATTTTSRARRKPAPQRVRPGLQRLLESISGPAWVQNWRLDLLAANRLGYALHYELYADPVRPVNSARFVFLNARSHEFFPDWERSANDIVAILCTEAGRHPYDRGLSDLVGELSTRSDDFRIRWAAQNVRLHRTGFKRIHHPVVGDLELNYEAMEFPADPGLTMFAYTAEPGSPSDDALKLLASWAVTQDVAETAPTSEDV
jgi:transcriptional regulator with XRE-family HTH domain